MDSSDIASLRKQIDAIDDEITRLLFTRIELSNRIIKIKPATQILDPSREDIILNRYSDKLSSVSTPSKLKRLVSAILGTSRLYPE